MLWCTVCQVEGVRVCILDFFLRAAPAIIVPPHKVPVIQFLPTIVKSLWKLILVIEAVVSDPLIFSKDAASVHLALAGAVIDVAGRQNGKAAFDVHHH